MSPVLSPVNRDVSGLLLVSLHQRQPVRDGLTGNAHSHTPANAASRVVHRLRPLLFLCLLLFYRKKETRMHIAMETRGSTHTHAHVPLSLKLIGCSGQELIHG